MKTRNITLTALLFAAIAFQASAQLDFGIKAGFGFYKFNESNSFALEETVSHNLVPRINIGLWGELPLGNSFSFNTGLFMVSKGSRRQITTTIIKEEHTSWRRWNLFYLELPVNINYIVRLKGGSVFLGGGPYLGYGITGRYYSNEGGQTDVAISFANEASCLAPTIRPIDYGLNFTTGYQFDLGISIGINAQLGLANVQSKIPMPMIRTTSKLSTEFDSTRKNIGFSFFVGYKF